LFPLTSGDKMNRRGHDAGRNATALMATCYVFTCGIAVCAFISLAFSQNPVQPILLASGISAAMLSLLWLLRDRRENRWLEGGHAWLLRRRPDEETLQYRPRLLRPVVREFGTNRPPTAAEIRELAQNTNTWVPSAGSSRHESTRGQVGE
jgi:hypothetical protein